MSRGSLSVFLCRYGLAVAVFLTGGGVPKDLFGEVVINEIMYHVKETEWKEDSTAEYVELYHSGDRAVSLEGWRFTSGIRFTFPAITMQPGDYWVVVADVEAFRARHPQVEHVLGPFRGRLSNGGEELVLEDADEKVVDELTYADSGNWANRVSSKLKGYDDWIWDAPHDGGGASLSLKSPLAKNEYGVNWAASEVEGGTPGQENDVRIGEAAIGPVVTSVRHDPPIPRSHEPVSVLVEVDHAEPVTLTLHYRRDGDREFSSLPVVEGRAEIAPMEDQAVVQFYIKAVDDKGRSSVYPHWAESGRWDRRALCLFQVDDGFDPEEEMQPGSKPTYRLISTAREWDLIKQLNDISGSNSAYDNHIHATFIAVDGVETQMRYHATARIRGHGSRAAKPPGLRVSFPSDHPWRGVTEINLNSQYTHSQSLGAVIHQLAGFAAGRSTPVHLRMNGEDWTREGSPQYGCYVDNEVFDDDYVASRFPGEEEGNMYRLVGSANLNDRGSDLEAYRTLYRKRNHASKDDFSDLIQLIEVLADAEPKETYYDRVNKVADLEQWARYLALDALLGNTEGGLPTGRGDDVAIFRRQDGRFQLIPYDLDSILGMGERGRQLNNGIFQYGNMPGFRHLFQNAQFLKLFTSKFIELTETVYRPEILSRLIDDQWGGWIPPAEIAEVKEFMERRIQVVLSQIQSSTVIGNTLEMENGFYKATEKPFALYGRFDRAKVEEVWVGGIRPQQFPETGMWIMPPERLKELVRPGMNQLGIVMRDGLGDVVAQETMRIWLDNGEVKRLSGPLPAEAEVRWMADEGPYLLDGDVLVPESTTLSIEEGTTVYGAAGGRLVVRGGLMVGGKGEGRVTFAKDPSAREAIGWGGIVFEQREGGPPHRLSKVDLLDLAGSIVGSRCRVHASGLRVQFVGAHGFSLSEVTFKLDSSTIDQNGPPNGRGNDSPVLTMSGGQLEWTRTVIRRPGGGPAWLLSDVASAYLFGNRVEQAATPVLLARGGASYLDGNDFSITTKSVDPVIQAPVELVATRNRVFGQVPTEGFIDLQNANEHAPRALPARDLVEAHAQFITPPPRRASEPRVWIEVGGPGIAHFRYQLDEQQWSERHAVEDGPVGIDVAPGQHRLRILGQHVSGKLQELSNDSSVEEVSFEVVPGLPSVMLSEVLASNETAHEMGGESSDYVEIHNFGTQPFDLSGFALSDDPEAPRAYVFPQGLVLEPGEYRVIPLGKDETDFALSADGDEILLTDREGQEVDRVRFGLQIPDLAISRLADDAWRLSVPTPGKPNKDARTGDRKRLEISEWYAVSSLSAPDEFIEIRNRSQYPVDLGGCFLTDQLPNRGAWHRLPPLSFIGAGARQVFLTDGQGDEGANHLGFRLSKEGEIVGLLDQEGALLDHAIFGPQKPGVAQGRLDDGSLYYGKPSPGEEGAMGAGGSDTSLVDTIRISEVHYHPRSGEDEEFIELVNIGSESMSLQGLAFTKGIEFSFGAFELEAGGRAVLVKDEPAFRKRYGDGVPIAGEFQGKLSNKGEVLALETAEGDTVVEFDYSDGWHKATDGKGASLTLKDLSAQRIDRKAAWQPSEREGGTPGE